MNLKKWLIFSFLFPLSLHHFQGIYNLEVKGTASENPPDYFKVNVIDLEANGDCTLITYKDIQILVDCGGETSSWPSIEKALNSSFKSGDKVLDYVIFSHGDADHVINFSGLSGNVPFVTKPILKSKPSLASWLLKKGFCIDTFIDFDPNKDPTNSFYNKGLFNLKSNNDEEGKTQNSTFSNYANTRDFLIDKRIIKNYFSSSQCLYKIRKKGLSEVSVLNSNENKSPDSAFVFDKGKEGTISILDNAFSYSDKFRPIESRQLDSLDRNLISTCLLIEFDGFKYLFTGDLPEFSSNGTNLGGETQLVLHNDVLKEGVLFYKAAHHGSNFSNTDYLLRYIRPQYIAISAEAGKAPYSFPGSSTIRTFAQYTDRIYITSKTDGKNSAPFFGDITFTYEPENKSEPLNVNCTSNSEKSIF